MERNRTEKFIILLISLACIGLTIESVLLGWEFWVPPLLIIGIISLWVMNFSEEPEYKLRRVLYFVFSCLAVFYHGVHETSFFDVALVVSFVLVTFSFFARPYMMHLLLVEYGVIMIIQFVLFNRNGTVFGTLEISRLLLHEAIVLMIYFSCIKAIREREDFQQINDKKDGIIEAYDADMEDFLTNISHELRTPVNVVNGIADLLIKRNAGHEASIIKNAGIRLSYQIEDIQDYTECKRDKVILEEEEYITTSLINDVVSRFRLIEEDKNIELVVDLAPDVPARMTGDIRKLHKIFRHLLENAVKFTKHGGVYLRVSSEATDYGVNLCIEMTDTGIGMDKKTLRSVSALEGMYQADRGRDRSSGGIGLGLFIVYGFAHKMGGFVIIESKQRGGTTVRITIPQRVADESPCLTLSESFEGDIVFHTKPDKYRIPKVRDFYRQMATNLALGIKLPLYSADNIQEIEHLREKTNLKIIFMGAEEYRENASYFNGLSRAGIVIAVSAPSDFKPDPGSRILVMPKPLYAYPVMMILNDRNLEGLVDHTENYVKPEFPGLKALIVDDEPMNLVVAAGLFEDYGMVIDTAGSGMEAINKYRLNDYDVVFMDHMMPEMDGVEAMKHIRTAASEMGKEIKVIALTANAVSGAREMFIREGFDGFIAKPIHLADFERVMSKEFKKDM